MNRPRQPQPAALERATPAVRIIWIVLIALSLAALVGLSYWNFLVFHALTELFSIAVAVAVVMVAWIARRRMDNDFLLFIAISLAAVAMLDMMHTLAYAGMGVFSWGGTNLPTQLWIATRYLQAACMLAAPIWLTRRLPVKSAIAALAIVDAALLLVLFRPWEAGRGGESLAPWLASALAALRLSDWVPVFPDCHLGAAGLTPFKIISEYVICSILLAAIAVLWRRREHLDKSVFSYFAASLLATVASEVSFTNYVSVMGPFNMIGHVLKIAAVFLAYKALVEAALRRPYDVLYRDLADGERRYRESFEAQRRTAVELARSNKELEQFGYIVSHDLQEPLRAVSGFLELLERKCAAEVGDKGREYIAFATDGARRMSQMIDDLLEYSRVQTRGRQPEPTDMNDVFREALANCSARVRETQGIVTGAELPTVAGDRMQLVQLLQNLIGNALKFRREGVRPEVRVEARRDDGRWVFEVRDNGIGIPADQIPRLFELFRRLHTRDKYPGTGIGLALCKKIIERHGGRIWIESKEGEGSRFCFSLPAAGNGRGN